jgi:hypothetical protein
MLADALPVWTLTRLEVENQVSRFWRFFMEKKYEQLRDCYSAEAQVCGPVTDRAESALTASSRRNIEYFAGHMKLQVSLGTITVQLVSGCCPQLRNLQQGAGYPGFRPGQGQHCSRRT